MTERRRFIATAGGVMAAAAAAAIVDAPHVIAQPKIQWRMSTAWTPALDVNSGRGPAAGEGRRRDERRAVPDRGLPGRPDHAAVRLLRRRLAGHHRGVHGFRVLLDREGARGRVVHDRPVRHEPRGHGGLVLPGRRAQALGGDLRRLQPRAAPGPGGRSADGRMVPEEDQHDRRLQGAQDAHWHGPRRQGLRQGGRHGGPHSGRRDLRRARAGRDRRQPNGSGRTTT